MCTVQLEAKLLVKVTYHAYIYSQFNNFKNAFSDVSDFIISEKGEEIISSKNDKSTKEKSEKASNNEATTDFTEVNFEDLGKD